MSKLHPEQKPTSPVVSIKVKKVRKRRITRYGNLALLKTRRGQKQCNRRTRFLARDDFISGCRAAKQMRHEIWLRREARAEFLNVHPRLVAEFVLGECDGEVPAPEQRAEPRRSFLR